jgi:endonuclease/exonuclease/phosphatase (EEP) superfamily protein YafD
MLNVGEIETRLKLYAGRPIMLCGDFNTTPESRVCRRLSESFEDSWARAGQGDGFTIPASQPTKRIDYIWITKDKSLKPLRAWVPQSNASDHLPVVAEFLLR